MIVEFGEDTPTKVSLRTLTVWANQLGITVHEAIHQALAHAILGAPITAADGSRVPSRNLTDHEFHTAAHKAAKQLRGFRATTTETMVGIHLDKPEQTEAG